MNTWTDSGLSEAGLIGAMLAIGVEARLPEGPVRSGRRGSRRRTGPSQRGDVARGDVAQRSGRRRAAEPALAPQVADRALAALSVPAADYADSYAGDHAGSPSGSGSHAAVEPVAGSPAPTNVTAMASSLTGSFPMNGVAKLYEPEPVPLPSEPLPPEPEPAASRPELAYAAPSHTATSYAATSHTATSHGAPSDSASSDSGSFDSGSFESPSHEPSYALSSVGSASSAASGSSTPGSSLSGSPSTKSSGDHDGLRSSTDGFLAGGFTSSSSDSSWGSGSSALSGDSGGSWSRPVPLSPSSALDAAVPAPTTMVREPLSPAVSAPTSLLPMPKTPATHHAESTAARHFSGAHAAESDDAGPRETYNVESSTLGSLDSSGLFAALSRRGR